MTGVSLRKSWRNHQDRAAATALNLALVLDRYVADTFGKADLAVLAVRDEVARRKTGPGADPRGLEAFVRRQHERVPVLLALRVFDARGNLVCGSGLGTGHAANISDRDYFMRLREDPGAGLEITRPVVGRVTGIWVINVARRLEYPDHGFAGTVVAIISLEQIQRMFASLDVGPHGSVALRGLDLGLIARHPEPGKAGTAVGEKVVSSDFAALVQSGRISGTFRTVIPFDRAVRVSGVRRVTGQPYYLSVGLAEEDYLAGWRREVAREGLEMGLFIGLTLTATWLIHRAWRRQRVAHETLERLLAEVKTLGGMLPICSHCKRIRDDRGYWNQIEAYLNAHTAAEFTHGVCPDCAEKSVPPPERRGTP
jgi:hypothetical protein